VECHKDQVWQKTRLEISEKLEAVEIAFGQQEIARRIPNAFKVL
jgi:hypothetical protein